MKKIILGRVLAFGLMFGMACTMMPNTVIKAAVESNSTEEDTVDIGNNVFMSYEELENRLKNVADVQQDSDTGVITVKMQKNVVGRICFVMENAYIIFNGNGKTLSGGEYYEPISLENSMNVTVELVGGGIYKEGSRNSIFVGTTDRMIIRNAVIIGTLFRYGSVVADLENGYKNYDVQSVTYENGTYTLGEYVKWEDTELKGCTSENSIYASENIAVIPKNTEDSTTNEPVDIGDNVFTSYEQLESKLSNVADVSKDDNGIIHVKMNKNIVGRICFDIEDAYIIFDGNGKTLSSERKYNEPLCVQHNRNSIVELVGGGIYKTGINHAIFVGFNNQMIIRDAYILGRLCDYYIEGDKNKIVADVTEGCESYDIYKITYDAENGKCVLGSLLKENCTGQIELGSSYGGYTNFYFAVVPKIKHVHDLTRVDAKEATCTENGNKEYYKCSCGELFADRDAQKKITLAEVEIEAKGHEYESLYDETQHWKKCKNCDAVTEKIAHEYKTEYTKDAKYHWKKCKNCDAVTEKQEHTSSGEATEETAEICNVCGYVIHPELGHIHTRHLTKVEAKEATCTEKGNKAYYKCSCEQLFVNKDAQKEITLAEVEIEAKGHEYESLYDETQHWKKCKNCDAVTEKIAHEYETEYTKDAKYHWKKCKNCDAVTEKQEHTSSGAATEENAETCTVCGYEIHEKIQKESSDSSMQWQTLNKAKLVTEKAFADYKAGKESDKSDIANVVAQALKENNLSNVAYEIISYEKTEPTSTTEGKISGIVKLTIGGYSTQVPFNYVIAKVEEPQKPAQITGKGAQTTDGQIKISWIKADGADGYRIYASVCDGESNYKLIKDTKDLTGAIKNLNNKKSYKFYVVAYKNVDGKKVRICKSMIYHVVLSDSKYTNVKAIKVAKTSYTLNVGDKQKLNAKSVKQEKNKKLLTHAQEFRYSSSDTTVATVSKTGEITAKQSGSCIIYVVANNGVMKKIKVNVA